MKKKYLSRVWFLFLLFLLLLLTAYLCISSFYRVSYTASDYAESEAELSNPYIGWYQMYGYVLGSESLSNLPDPDASSDAASQGLVMLEINLRNFADSDLSEYALSQLSTILSAWQKNGNQIILRFLYDWDGKAEETEPKSLEQILRHMEQTATVVNQYPETVYLLQGIFVGNCGEMHHSVYMQEESFCTLAKHLADLIDPSIFLSVRTPVQRRILLGSAALPDAQTAFDGSFSSRLGLFNDGMLGTANDTGTYGDTPASDEAYHSAWIRADELSFQDILCRFVPNGGEVVLDNPYNDLPNAISDLSQMHVSYLNPQHDLSVLDKWKNTVYTEKGSVFDGLSGYDYIGRHMGYRYVLRNSRLSQKQLQISLENVGFSNCYRQLQAQVTFVSQTSGETFSYALDSDARFWNSGTTVQLEVSLPLSSLPKNSYTVYLQLTDPALQRTIQFANTAEQNAQGFCLGTLSLTGLF